VPPADLGNASLAAMTRLRRIAKAMAGTPDGDWLDSALFVYEIRAPKGGRFDEALGLAPGPGQEPWFSAERRAARDAAIRELTATFSGPPTSRAHAAGQAIRHYGSTTWRQDRPHRGPPSPDHRRKLLHAIFSADENPPMSMRRVHDIVRG
jgi:hypothetical protein